MSRAHSHFGAILRNFILGASGPPTGDAHRGWVWRGWRGPWPLGCLKRLFHANFCPRALPSTTHFAILEQWLWSGSPCMSLCKCCPTTFPRKLTETRRHDPRWPANEGAFGRYCYTHPEMFILIVFLCVCGAFAYEGLGNQFSEPSQNGQAVRAGRLAEWEGRALRCKS